MLWVTWSALLPVVCPVYLCMNVGPQGATRRSACPGLHHSESSPLGLSVPECGVAGSASGQTACPVHSTLRQSQSRHSHASPLCPSACLHPSLPFDFLSVLVVRGGTVCLPTLPSWFLTLSFLNSRTLSIYLSGPLRA